MQEETTNKIENQEENDLTETQAKVLTTIKEFVQKNGFSPTVREIAEILNVTSNTVFGLLQKLIKKNYISRKRHVARSISIIKDPQIYCGSRDLKMKKIPILGTIAAGTPVFADENMKGVLLVDEGFIKKGSFFALEIKGDSMVDAGINDSDVVVIRRQPIAESGDIIAALIDGEAALKRLLIDNYQVILLSENEKYPPIDVTCREDFKILGKLVTVISVQN